MIPSQTEEAFAEYEAVRHLLPPALPRSRDPVLLGSLADLAGLYDVFLLDAFGVLNIGEEAIAGTPGRVADLIAAGKRVMVVSNAASMNKAALVRKYRALGYPFEARDVISSRDALIAGLHSQDDLDWGVMAVEDDDLSDFGDLRLTRLGDDPAPYDAVEGFLLIGSATWTETRQALLEAALFRKARPLLVGNPDIVAPRGSHFSSEPGRYAHRLTRATKIKPEFFGKPYMGIYDLVFARLGPVSKDRVLMVGDSLHTDILGAHTASVASALISDFGFFSDSDPADAITRSGITPTYVLSCP